MVQIEVTLEKEREGPLWVLLTSALGGNNWNILNEYKKSEYEYKKSEYEIYEMKWNIRNPQNVSVRSGFIGSLKCFSACYH